MQYLTRRVIALLYIRLDTLLIEWPVQVDHQKLVSHVQLNDMRQRRCLDRLERQICVPSIELR